MNVEEGNTITTPAVGSQYNRLIVTFEESSISGIDNTPAAAPSKVKVLGSADGIHITNANPGDVVSVYGMDGRMVYNQKLSGTQADIALKSNTLYIIKVADKTIKVKL